MRTLSLVVLVAAASCGAPITIVKFSTSSAFIESAIPAEQFADGWSVKFDKFLVILRDAAVVDADGRVGAQQPGAKAFDLTKPGPVELFSATAEAKQWPVVRYTIGTDTGALAGNISDTDLALLKSRAASVIVTGKGTNGPFTKSFEWSFSSNTLYDACTSADGKAGVTLLPSQTVEVQLTVHGDRFFADQLGTGGKLRFEAIGTADGNNDGKVTLDELAAVQLETLPAGQYGTGEAMNVLSLKDFITQNVRSLGHFQGMGTCTSRAR